MCSQEIDYVITPDTKAKPPELQLRGLLCLLALTMVVKPLANEGAAHISYDSQQEID